MRLRHFKPSDGEVIPHVHSLHEYPNGIKVVEFNRYDEEQVELDAEREEYEREHFTRWLVHKPGGKTHITEYESDAPVITRMEKVAKKLATTTTAPTKTVMNDEGSKQ